MLLFSMLPTRHRANTEGTLAESWGTCRCSADTAWCVHEAREGFAQKWWGPGILELALPARRSPSLASGARGYSRYSRCASARRSAAPARRRLGSGHRAPWLPTPGGHFPARQGSSQGLATGHGITPRAIPGCRRPLSSLRAPCALVPRRGWWGWGWGALGWRPHLNQDGKEEAGAELLDALGGHAAVIAVVGLLLQGLGLKVGQLPAAWEEGGCGASGRVLCMRWPQLGEGWHTAPCPGEVALAFTAAWLWGMGRWAATVRAPGFAQDL